jgi:hypothetical protein
VCITLRETINLGGRYGGDDMGSFVAVLILVACPVGSSTCLEKPVRIVSYDSSLACMANREMEVRKASRPGFEILGDCNAFNAKLLAGKAHLNVTRDVATLNAQSVQNTQLEAVSGFAK